MDFVPSKMQHSQNTSVREIPVYISCQELWLFIQWHEGWMILAVWYKIVTERWLPTNTLTFMVGKVKGVDYLLDGPSKLWTEYSDKGLVHNEILSVHVKSCNQV